MELLKIKIQPGEEVMSVLKSEFEKRKLQTGTVTSVIGGVDKCVISNMPKEDAMKDIETEYEGPMELSGVGEIREGEPHIHCTVSMEGDKTVHGHLHSAEVKSWYVSVYILVVEKYAD